MRSTSPAPVWVWRSGLVVTHLRAPHPAWGGRVFGELERSSLRGAITPALRLSWGWSDFSVDAPRAGEARFRLQSARLEGCARVRTRSAFAIAPCAALDVGTLSGVTPELRGASKVTTPWVAPGVILRGSWSPSEWVSVELDAALLVPLERTSFVLREPFRPVYRAPSVLFEGSAGACLSVRFR